jgi:hypothetical protein
MDHTPYMNLQALPDFSAFQFSSTGTAGTVVRQVRFSGQKDGRIYHLDLRDLPAGKKSDPALLADNGDMDQVMATVIQIIEIYTERYPRRTIRLKGNTGQKAQLYRAALDKHLPILCPLFLIELEEKLSAPDSGREIDAIAFLLKRKPIPYLTFHTFQTIWSGQSRLFGKKVKIELEKGIRIGVALPAV